jgi:NTE family protein
MEKIKSALVLSGGGALGLAHVGALKRLEKQYRFDCLFGVSAGAIVTAGMACGMNAKQIETAIKKTNLFDMAFDFSWKNTGLITGDAIRDSLNEIYGERTFEDLNVPLFIGATDFSTGERVTLSEGNIAAAVRASMAVPVLFEPYFHKPSGRYLVDGGLTQNFPIDLAMETYQGDKIIGIDVANVKPVAEDFHTDKFFGRNKDLVKNLQRTFRIFFQSQQQFTPDERVEIFRPDLSDFSSSALSHSTHLAIIEAGEKSLDSPLITHRLQSN